MIFLSISDKRDILMLLSRAAKSDDMYDDENEG